MSGKQISNKAALFAVAMALAVGFITSLAVRPVHIGTSQSLDSSETQSASQVRVRWRVPVVFQTTWPVLGDNPVYVSQMIKEAKVIEKLSDKTRTAKILSSRTIHTPVLINLKTESASFLFKLGNDLIELTPCDDSASSDFTLEATEFAWRELQKPFPKPGFQCLSTMRRTQNLKVRGNTKKFNQNLLILEMLFSNIVDSPPQHLSLIHI